MRNKHPFKTCRAVYLTPFRMLLLKYLFSEKKKLLQNDSIIAYRYSRKSNNSVSRTPIEADRETSPENRRRGSASRANRTLEQLLSDPTSSTTELLAALDKDEKSNRNQQTKEAAGGAESDNREYGDLSLSDAISGRNM